MRKTLIAAGVLTLIGPNICHAQTRPISKVEHALITDSYGRVLKDAASAQYRMQPIPLADNQKDGTTIYCFEVNAKNSYGGYAGYKAVRAKWPVMTILRWADPETSKLRKPNNGRIEYRSASPDLTPETTKIETSVPQENSRRPSNLSRHSPLSGRAQV